MNTTVFLANVGRLCDLQPHLQWIAVAASLNHAPSGRGEPIGRRDVLGDTLLFDDLV